MIRLLNVNETIKPFDEHRIHIFVNLVCLYLCFYHINELMSTPIELEKSNETSIGFPPDKFDYGVYHVVSVNSTEYECFKCPNCKVGNHLENDIWNGVYLRRGWISVQWHIVKSRLLIRSSFQDNFVSLPSGNGIYGKFSGASNMISSIYFR